jgi:site-specific recombinase XerD
MASTHKSSSSNSATTFPSPNIFVVQFVNEFNEFLESVRGLTLHTRRGYCRFVGNFLAEWSSDGQLDWQQLRAEDLRAYARREMASKTRRPSGKPFVSIRAMLRYLEFKGAKPPGLDGVLPRMRKWRHAALPHSLTATEVERAISFAAVSQTKHPLRNQAIVILLATTGIRAGEAVKLTLDDIDWGNGVIHIRNAKCRQDRDLPLLREVGRGLLAYIKRERPCSTCREIFLSRLGRPFASPSGICRVVHHTFVRAEIHVARGAAHLLRHAAATNMRIGGANFKAIADVLGHRSLDSTAIYAKLDLPSLSGIAMPWPGDAP